MDEAELKEYIREKSNGRNVVPIRIIDSLLHHEVASRKQLWHDVLVYVRKNYMNLPGSFHDPTLRRDKRLLEKRFSSALSSLVKDGAITEQKGRDEFMIGMDYPIDDYDVDHPLSMLIWAELDVTPKDPAYDYMGSDDAAKAVKSVERTLQDAVADYNIWDVENVQRKAGSDDITINFDLVKKHVEMLPSLTKSIGKTVHDATPEMIAFRTIREMEKYMRKFVVDVMRHHDNWWKTKAPSDVRKKVHERMVKKKLVRARSDVKLDPIMRLLNDTDMGQLIEIIRANPNEFDKAFGDKNLERIKPFLTGLYERRNAIDHPDETIPIDEEFLGALDYLCTYVMKQTEIYYQETSSD